MPLTVPVKCFNIGKHWDGWKHVVCQNDKTGEHSHCIVHGHVQSTMSGWKCTVGGNVWVQRMSRQNILIDIQMGTQNVFKSKLNVLTNGTQLWIHNKNGNWLNSTELQHLMEWKTTEFLTTAMGAMQKFWARENHSIFESNEKCNTQLVKREVTLKTAVCLFGPKFDGAASQLTHWFCESQRSRQLFGPCWKQWRCMQLTWLHPQGQKLKREPASPILFENGHTCLGKASNLEMEGNCIGLKMQMKHFIRADNELVIEWFLSHTRHQKWLSCWAVLKCVC